MATVDPGPDAASSNSEPAGNLSSEPFVCPQCTFVNDDPSIAACSVCDFANPNAASTPTLVAAPNPFDGLDPSIALERALFEFNRDEIKRALEKVRQMSSLIRRQTLSRKSQFRADESTAGLSTRARRDTCLCCWRRCAPIPGRRIAT